MISKHAAKHGKRFNLDTRFLSNSIINLHRQDIMCILALLT